jgi:hypothetical protein
MVSGDLPRQPSQDGVVCSGSQTPVGRELPDCLVDAAQTDGSTVYSDGLACFSAVTQVGCTHECTVVAGRKPKDVPELQWINTVLGNLRMCFT